MVTKNIFQVTTQPVLGSSGVAELVEHRIIVRLDRLEIFQRWDVHHVRARSVERSVVVVVGKFNSLTAHVADDYFLGMGDLVVNS